MNKCQFYDNLLSFWNKMRCDIFIPEILYSDLWPKTTKLYGLANFSDWIQLEFWLHSKSFFLHQNVSTWLCSKGTFHFRCLNNTKVHCVNPFSNAVISFYPCRVSIDKLKQNKRLPFSNRVQFSMSFDSVAIKYSRAY